MPTMGKRVSATLSAEAAGLTEFVINADLTFDLVLLVIMSRFLVIGLRTRLAHCLFWHRIVHLRSNPGNEITGNEISLAFIFSIVIMRALPQFKEIPLRHWFIVF